MKSRILFVFKLYPIGIIEDSTSVTSRMFHSVYSMKVGKSLTEKEFDMWGLSQKDVSLPLGSQ